MSNENKINYKKIRHQLEEALDEARYEHTLGVAKVSMLLANIHDVDTEKAYLAGLLHDCAKNISTDKKRKLCKKFNVEITEIEDSNPSLLHSKVGAIVAKESYNVEDEDILNAIRNHTTGRPNMSPLEKIVFIADYIEPGRAERPELNSLRILAFNDLDECIYKITKDTLEYLSDSAKAIDPATQATYNYYEKLIMER